MPPGGRFGSLLSFKMPDWASTNRLNTAFLAVLAVVIVGATASLVYAVGSPRVVETFTEFYLLGPQGKAQNYTTELVSGEQAKVMVGIANWEHTSVSYRVEVTIDGGKDREVGPVVLAHSEKWERELDIAVSKTGYQKVEFWLYRDGQSEAYRSVHLWINVKEKG